MALDILIAEARHLIDRYRREGRPMDALAAQIRLRALLDAKEAVGAPR